eukprot:m51a1_g2086 hypothetical protein (337) ;mRNA; r:1513483-1514493
MSADGVSLGAFLEHSAALVVPQRSAAIECSFVDPTLLCPSASSTAPGIWRAPSSPAAPAPVSCSGPSAPTIAVAPAPADPEPHLHPSAPLKHCGAQSSPAGGSSEAAALLAKARELEAELEAERRAHRATRAAMREQEMAASSASELLAKERAAHEQTRADLLDAVEARDAAEERAKVAELGAASEPGNEALRDVVAILETAVRRADVTADAMRRAMLEALVRVASPRSPGPQRAAVAGGCQTGQEAACFALQRLKAQASSSAVVTKLSLGAENLGGYVIDDYVAQSQRLLPPKRQQKQKKREHERRKKGRVAYDSGLGLTSDEEQDDRDGCCIML